jgi:hypothetical protein
LLSAYRDQQHQDAPERCVEHDHLVVHQDAGEDRVQSLDAGDFLSLDDPECHRY